jgi:beta-galactosidase
MTAPVALSCVFGLGVCFSLLGSIGVKLMPRLAIDRGRFGTLISAFMFTCLIVSLLAGLVTDKVGYGPVAVFGFAAAALGILLLARARTFASAVLCCVGLGFGAMALNTAGNTLIPVVLFGGTNPAAASNLGNVFFGLGLFLTPLLVSFLFRKMAYPAAVSLVGLLVLVPIAPAVWAAYPKAAAGIDLASAASLLADPVVLLGAAVLLFYSSIETSFCNWLTPCAKELIVQTRPDCGEAAADASAQRMLSIFAVAMMAGRLITSQVPNVTQFGQWIVAGVMLAAAAVVIVLATAKKASRVPLLAALSGLLLAPCFPTTVGLVFARHPANFGSVFGIIFAAAMLGGVVVPKAIGNLAKGATVQKSLRLLVPICLLVAACVIALGTRKPGRSVPAPTSEEAVIALSGDSRGNIVGTVSKDFGRTGLSGETVTVSGDSWSRTAATGENGLFSVAAPLDVRGRVTAEARGAKTAIDAADIPLRLTARPKSGRQSLEGPWQILVDPPADWRNATGWRPIDVPSHWEMKGFRAKSETAVLRKVFDLPAAWRGKRVKLRADGIYSRCEAWLNGVRVGAHDGGATPVELDLTDAAKPGAANTLDVFIWGRSAAARIDNMSVYAYFELAGIWRPIEVFAVEPAHVSRVHWSVDYDDAFRNADLSVEATVANAQDAAAGEGTLAVRLLDPDGRLVKTGSAAFTLAPWEEKTTTLHIGVPGPEAWTAERPRLYTLDVSYNGRSVESPVGFREIEVHGKLFTINGRAAKLFGVCMHSADPRDGRAIPPALVEKDLGLVKGANLNAIRTSHYPPHPHLPEVADRIGLYIEDEGPACWADTDDLRDVPLYLGIYASFVERDRNHPSVVYWSICNESNYTRLMQITQQYIKRADPTRPSSGSYAPETDKADMVVRHHPTNLHEYIRSQAGVAKPVFMDECQTVFHGWGDLAVGLEVDPGMHDYWITHVADVVDACFETENQVGTMIWAWVDDAALVPGRGIENTRRDMPKIRYTEPIYAGPGHGYVGDTVWGMVDGWRRPRPEWELCRQAYSPVQIPAAPLTPGNPVRVPAFNQNVFENLALYECRWAVAGKSGTVRPDVPPRSEGTIVIPAEAGSGDTLELRFFDGGRPLSSFTLRFKPRAPEPWTMGAAAEIAEEKDRYLSGASVVYLRGDGCELAYERVSGELMWGLANDTQVLLKGPRLHVLKSEAPAGDDPAGWTFTGETHGDGTIRWNGRFGNEWTGGYDVRLDREGRAEFSYDFTYNGPDLWVRELGLEFDLPLSFGKLEWERQAEYTSYPDDYIGRPRGVALAHPAVPQTVPPGDRPFALDDHAWGSNDFRSSKRGVYWASLSGPGGAVKVVSDGTQTVRCAVTPHEVRLNVLDFYGGSGGPKEWSVVGFQYGAGRLIKKGETVKGTVRLKIKNLVS